MKKLICCSLLALVFTPCLDAQITITNAVFPVVGDTLHYAFGNQPGAINQIFTPPGGGQHWDLGNLQATQFWNQIMNDPGSGIAHASFPGASILYHPINSTSEVYLKVTADQVLEMGYYGLDQLGLGLSLLFKKLPSLEESWAPGNFFDIKQSSSNVLTAFSAFSAPAILLNLAPTADSFRIRLTNQRIGVIDAYGTLTIPGGTFDVLRKKQTEYISTAVDVKVPPLGWIDISTIGGQQILPLGTDTITSFHFLNHVSKEAIAICTLNTAQNTVLKVQYKDVALHSSTASPASQNSLVIYPNPVGQTLQMRFNNDVNGLVQIRLINTDGAIALERKVMALAGENDISVPVAGLPAGRYEVVLLGAGRILGAGRVLKW